MVLAAQGVFSYFYLLILRQKKRMVRKWLFIYGIKQLVEHPQGKLVPVIIDIIAANSFPFASLQSNQTNNNNKKIAY